MPPATRFRLDPAQSRVAIHATSSVHPIDGEATGLEGYVELAVAGGEPDLATPAQARVELPVAALASGNPVVDLELRRRLDARRHPRIVGVLTAVAPGDSPGRYRVEGDLSFHGATHRVGADVAVSLDGAGLTASWEQTIDVRNFGVRPPRVLMLAVDPEVRIEVDVVAVPDDA